MKTISNIILLILALSLLAPTIVSAKGGNRVGLNMRTTTVTVLTAEQVDTLLWMREEEKLARDVYLKMDKFWGQAIFKNIASAEQQHMDALLKKIDSFGLTDSALTKRGKFNNEDLQVLYDELIDRGGESYIDALKVGVTIEELDILDLIDAIKETDNLALKTTYQNLLEGSKNHLRAFVGRLQQQDEDYQLEEMNQDLFDAILGL